MAIDLIIKRAIRKIPEVFNVTSTTSKAVLYCVIKVFRSITLLEPKSVH